MIYTLLQFKGIGSNNSLHSDLLVIDLLVTHLLVVTKR